MQKTLGSDRGGAKGSRKQEQGSEPAPEGKVTDQGHCSGPRSYLAAAPLMLKRSLASTAFLAVIIAYYWRLRQRGGSLISPPYCAWRFLSNFQSWNVAFPDRSSIYHVSLMHLNEGDEVRITGTLPNCRYFSYQAYDIPAFMAKSSLRDFEIVPDEGPNLFSNLTAAVNGEPQGTYTIYITPHGDKNYTNELRAMPDDQESGFFVLFLRIYQTEVGTSGHHPGTDLSCFHPGGQYPKERPQEWGWACPPKVEIKRRHWQSGNEFKPLPMCAYRRKQGIKLYNDVTEPWQQCESAWDYNQRNNFFLPRPAHLNGKFGNKDAKYLYSCANASTQATMGGQELWARVTGVLPRTPKTLTQAPLIANLSDYEVRYVSLSSVSRSIPYRAYGTLNDVDISRFYTEQHEATGEPWDGRYTIWVGPEDAENLPQAIEEDKALRLTWGKSFKGENIPYPSILYRQILSRGQVLRSFLSSSSSSRGVRAVAEEQDSTYHPSGLADVLPDYCLRDFEDHSDQGSSSKKKKKRKSQQQQRSCGSEEEEESERRAKTVCCGAQAPDWCYDPSHVQNRMQMYYPEVEYYLRSPGSQELLAPVRK